MKKYVFLTQYILLGLLCGFLNGCNSIDENLAEQDVYSIAKVENSKEFRKYEKEYAELVLQMRTIIDSTSEIDRRKVIELYRLYLSEPERYKDLLECQVKNIVGVDSIFFIEKATTLNVAKKELLESSVLENVDEFGKIELSGRLMSNAYQLVRTEDPVMTVKTRSESSPCQQRCEREREEDLNFARKMAACATVVNTATCILTAGGSALAWWVTEFGIAYVHDETVKKAWRDYESCVSSCS